MGGIESQSVTKFDPATAQGRSKETTLLKHNKLVIFGENTENQVAYFLDPISSSKDDLYSLKLSVKCVQGGSEDEEVSSLSLPIIGLALSRSDPDHIVRKSLCAWKLSEGTVEFQGNEDLKLYTPKVKNHGVLDINLDLSSMVVSVIVANPGEKEEDMNVNILTEEMPSQLYPYVGVLNSSGKLSSAKTIFSILDEEKEEVDFTKHITFGACYGTIETSPNGKRVGRISSQQGNGCVLLPIKMSYGVHRWTFIVHSDFGASMCVGVAQYPFKLLEEYVEDQLKHIYRHPRVFLYRSYRGLLYSDGKQLEHSFDGLHWIQGHDISLELVYNGDEGSLEILKNGKSLGVAFKGLVGTFQPIICFYAAYEKDLELHSYKTTESLSNVLLAQATERDGLSSKGHLSKDFCFDESSVYGKLKLSADKKTISRMNETGNAFAFTDQTCSQEGTYRFSFVIEADQGASTCVGVTTVSSKEKVKISGHIYNSDSLYLYRSFQGMVYARGRELSKRLDNFWMTGTLLEMEVTVTSTASSVRFKVNAVDQGVIFSNLPITVTPIVAFYAEMKKTVTYLHFEYEPAPLKLSAPRLASLGEEAATVLNDTSIGKSFASSHPLPLTATIHDPEIYNPFCLKCKEESSADSNVDVIALPCKHAVLCSKHLVLGLNSPSKRCPACDRKITGMWNILLKSKSFSPIS